MIYLLINQTINLDKIVSIKPQEIDSNQESLRLKRISMARSCTNIQQVPHSPKSPINQLDQFSKQTDISEQQQSYSKTIMKIFTKLNQQKQQNIRQDQQFTRTCTTIQSIKDLHYQNASHNKQFHRSGSQNFSQSHSIKLQSDNSNYNTPKNYEIKNLNKNNQSDIASFTSNNISSYTPQNHENSQQSFQRKSLKSMSLKAQMSYFYQKSASFKRLSFSGNKQNWMTQQNKRDQVSTTNSFSSSELLQPIQGLAQIAQINKFNELQQHQQSQSIMSIFSRQQTDDVKTPTSCDTSKSQYVRNGILKNSQKSSIFLPQQNNEKQNQNNTKSLSNTRKVSNFNELAKYECSRKETNYVEQQQDEQQSPQFPQELQSPLQNNIISLSNIQNLHEVRKSDTFLAPSSETVSPELISLNNADQKTQQKQQMRFQNRKCRTEFILNDNKSQESITDENCTQIINRSPQKIQFKKAQIFQTKKEIKTKEVKVYDDSLKMLTRNTNGENELELIQLPFYRKKIVVLPESQQIQRQNRVTSNERNSIEQKQAQTIKKSNQDYLQLSQFQQKQEFNSNNKSGQQLQNQILKLYPSSMNQIKTDIDVSTNLQNIQINQQVKRQKELQLNKGVNLHQIKQALNSTQNETIMGLICPQNKYQTNLFSKQYQNNLLEKK